MIDEKKTKRSRASEFIAAAPWAILEEHLELIQAVADRLGDDPEAVATKLGRPLENTQEVTIRDGVAIIPVSGPIFRHANMFTRISGATSIEILSRDFAASLKNPKVESILLNIDSPGGQVSGVSEFADMIFNARGEKPIVAYISDIGASAGYWIASAADKIIAADTAKVGSIGVVVRVERGGDDDSIQIVSSQSPRKNASIETEGGRAAVQEYIDDLATVFVAKMAKHRDVSEEKVLSDFGQGSLFVGQKAVDAGLVNQIGSFEGTLAEMSGTSVVNSKGVIPMTVENQPMTRDFILANHPELAEAFKSEGFERGKTAGKEEGAKDERARIEDVYGQLKPGHEDAVKQLMFDGKSNGGDAAKAILSEQAAIGEQKIKDIKTDSPPAANQPPAAAFGKDDAESAVDPNLPLADQCKQRWDKSPDLRDEFQCLEDYQAFMENEGRAKIFSKN